MLSTEIFFFVFLFCLGIVFISQFDSLQCNKLFCSHRGLVAVAAERNASAAVTPKIAYLFAGSVRSFVCPKVHWSIRHNLLEALSGDARVFVRTTLEDNLNTKTGAGRIWTPNNTHVEVTEALKVLNPEEIEYFSFSRQEKEMQRDYPQSVHRIFRENDQRRYSMYYHRCKSYQMMLRYEVKHGIRFDWVVLARLDAAWLDQVLPIESYATDRVWLTETAFDNLNDQFMLIPRSYSDYIYDLNTKVRKPVYCLGGPDVEVAEKCAPTASVDVRNYCCSDALRGNSVGGSEKIHLRHLLLGKIPIALARFPVFLVRIHPMEKAPTISESMSVAPNQAQICNPECFRTRISPRHYFVLLSKKVYSHYNRYKWPDTLGKGMSLRDQTLCHLIHTRHHVWNPIPAVHYDKVLRTVYDRIVSPTARIHSAPNAIRSKYAKELYRYYARHLAPSVSSSLPLRMSFSEFRSLIDVNYMRAQLRDTQLYQIRPVLGPEACLSLPFKPSLGVFWSRCRDYWSRSGGIRHDSRQLFLLQLETQRIDTSRRNATRIMLAHSFDRFSSEFTSYCLTVTDKPPTQGSRVTMISCMNGPEASEQLFLPVQGALPGRNPSTTTIGQLRTYAQPNLCVRRGDEHNANGYALTIVEGSAKYAQAVKANATRYQSNLQLGICTPTNNIHLTWFEFRWINPFY